MSYRGVVKDGPAEGQHIEADNQHLRVPIREKLKPTDYYGTLPSASATINAAHYVHITDHNGTGWWLWEDGWLIRLIRHTDRERYNVIRSLLG